MLLYVHLCNVDKIKYKTIEKDFYERFSYCIYNPQIEMFARFKMKSSFHKTKRII